MSETTRTGEGEATPPDPEVTTRRRVAVNEDWAATVIGLALLLLLITGALDPALVP